MYASYPVYTPSQKYAIINGEFDLWKESFNINMKCKEFITDNIYFLWQNNNFNEFIKELTDTFGLERAVFVLARTIQNEEFADRFGDAVKQRANQVIYEDKMLENRDDFKYDRSRFFAISAFSSYMEKTFEVLMEMEREQVNFPDAELERDDEREAC